MQSIEDYIERTLACQTETGLFELFDDFVGAYGVIVSSYNIIAEHLQAVPVENTLVRETFPRDWVMHYIRKRYWEIDPISDQARREARPFRPSKLAQMRHLDARQKQFLADLEAAGLSEGIAVPVFGPLGTMAYFGLARVKETLELTRAQELTLQYACLQTHNRYFDLASIEQPIPRKPLSPREKQVLSLVAGGLSNVVIAERMNITENTVDTLLRRVFIKLGVNNRISAVLTGLGEGLILPPQS